MTIRTLFTLGLLAILAPLHAVEKADASKPVELALEDQFERKQSLADHRGKIVIVVFGDRKGTESSRELGSKLHVLFHPSAEGQPPEKARKAPVAPLPGVPAGVPSPDVTVIPVAVAGKVPDLVKGLIRSSLRKDAAELPVWLDFGTAMTDQFGIKEGEPNLVLIDSKGRLRLKLNGMPDKAGFEKVLQMTQNLRAEAAGLR
jgi:hypothetical protein